MVAGRRTDPAIAGHLMCMQHIRLDPVYQPSRQNGPRQVAQSPDVELRFEVEEPHTGWHAACRKDAWTRTDADQGYLVSATGEMANPALGMDAIGVGHNTKAHVSVLRQELGAMVLELCQGSLIIVRAADVQPAALEGIGLDCTSGVQQA